MHVRKQAAAAQGGGIKGVPGERFCAANAANCRLDLILRTPPRKGSAAFLLGNEALSGIRMPESAWLKPIRGRRVRTNLKVDSP
jgi:hypothetical protein